MRRSNRQASSPAQGRGGSFISDSGSRGNFMTDVQSARPEGAKFDLSKPVKLTFDMGYLVPCLVMEGLPKDQLKFRAETFARFQALVSPAMHRFDVTVELFYTPYRILWDGWKEYIASVHNGNLTPPAAPYFTDLEVDVCSEADYFGFPLKVIDKVSPFVFSASNLIWNEYYRNPAIDDELIFKLTDGLNSKEPFNVLKKKRWNSDYFTRSLPAPQAGAPVTFPIGTSAPVIFDNDEGYGLMITEDGSPIGPGNNPLLTSGDGVLPRATLLADGTRQVSYDPNGTLKADLSDATSITVSDWRLAIKLQEWAERAMRFVGGAKGRYKDFMRGFFNAVIPDETLQRPVYLGGMSQPMVINGVTQTSETSSTPLGELGGQGVSIGANGFKNSYQVEHGIYIAYICCRPKTSYMDGLPKMFSKFDPIEYGHPDFSHLSEQPVYNKEVYYDDDGLNDEPFGWQPIYSDYRYNNGSTHGLFRTTQDFWTEARKFSLRPVLNTSFVECTPAQRIFALQPMPVGSQIQCEMFWDIDGWRQLPFYGTPMN